MMNAKIKLFSNIKITPQTPNYKDRVIDKYNSNIIIERRYCKVKSNSDELYGIKKTLIKY